MRERTVASAGFARCGAKAMTTPRCVVSARPCYTVRTCRARRTAAARIRRPGESAANPRGLAPACTPNTSSACMAAAVSNNRPIGQTPAAWGGRAPARSLHKVHARQHGGRKRPIAARRGVCSLDAWGAARQETRRTVALALSDPAPICGVGTFGRLSVRPDTPRKAWRAVVPTVALIARAASGPLSVSTPCAACAPGLT